MDDISQAAHIVAGMGCTFREALIMVAAANHYAENPAAPITVGSVIYGVDFAARRRIDHGQLA
jgi:hypothetical protein